MVILLSTILWYFLNYLFEIYLKSKMETKSFGYRQDSIILNSLKLEIEKKKLNGKYTKVIRPLYSIGRNT